MDIHFDLPSFLWELIDQIRKHGYECFLVGGAVRDMLLGKEPKDYDLATNATVPQIEFVFDGVQKINSNGRKHGTVTVRTHKHNVEISTYRFEEGRRPTIEEDLAHRDLTINAMAYDGEKLLDPYGGQADINAHRLKTPMDPEKIFREDPLRMLRILRFHAKYGYDIDPSISEQIRHLASLIMDVAKERVLTELREVLLAQDITDVLLRYDVLFASLFPDLRDTIGFDQHNHWHAHELYDHIAHVVGKTKPDFITRLAALLHDNGKVHTVSIEKKDAEIIYHFPAHPFVSAQLAEPILKQYRLPSVEVAQILFLIRFHDSKIVATRQSVRRFLAHCSDISGIDPLTLLSKLLDLQQADHADHTILIPIPVEEILSIAKDILENKEAFSLKDLAIDGNDLMKMGLQGKAIGVALHYALEEVMSERAPNEKDALLQRIRAAF